MIVDEMRLTTQSITFILVLLAACAEEPLASRVAEVAQAACSASDQAAFQQIVEQATRDPELARLDDPLIAQAEAARDPALGEALQQLQVCRQRISEL
jgi:hypothetical protein